VQVDLPEIVRVGTGLICILIVLFGVRWQARTFHGDIRTHQRRMKSALGLALLCVVGAIVWFAYSMIDPRAKLTPGEGLRYILGISLLSLAFIGKTWLGPILVSASASWAAYMLVEYGELSLLPVFEFVVRALSDWVPQGATPLYALITILHGLLGATYSSLKVTSTVA